MIFFPTVEKNFDSAESVFRSNQVVTTAVCKVVAVDEEPTSDSVQISLAKVVGEISEMQPPQVNLVEEFDWSDPKLNREFIKLEQKALAQKATNEELSRYYSMKSGRDSIIFSERYIADYAEMQRLKILSEKIIELQKYLKPIRLG
jgi:hypothetical protein